MRNFTAKDMRNRSSTFNDRRDRRANDARKDPVEEAKKSWADDDGDDETSQCND